MSVLVRISYTKALRRSESPILGDVDIMDNGVMVVHWPVDDLRYSAFLLLASSPVWEKGLGVSGPTAFAFGCVEVIANVSGHWGSRSSELFLVYLKRFI